LIAVSHQQRSGSDFVVERVTRLTPELVEAMGRLVPQLSPGRQPPTESELSAMLGDDRVHLLVARSGDGAI
jgi:hypothetical protein